MFAAAITAAALTFTRHHLCVITTATNPTTASIPVFNAAATATIAVTSATTNDHNNLRFTAMITTTTTPTTFNGHHHCHRPLPLCIGHCQRPLPLTPPTSSPPPPPPPPPPLCRPPYSQHRQINLLQVTARRGMGMHRQGNPPHSPLSLSLQRCVRQQASSLQTRLQLSYPRETASYPMWRMCYREEGRSQKSCKLVPTCPCFQVLVPRQAHCVATNLL
mmetsp:Transcript_14752/g.39136  ORF Transcript_14752/g.39136 Transcript_14752/m.39136 type:complete len:219 (+) Transcript_14752:25-681(+)